MAYTPGQKLPAAQLNASFGAKADQTALNSVSVIAASAKAVTDALGNATAPAAGVISGSDQFILTRGTGVLEAPTTAIRDYLAGAWLNLWLLQWAYVQAFQLVSAIRDANEAIVTANIVWPDGTSGVFTTDAASTAFPGAIDAWHATYLGSLTKTVTQPAVTRDANGAVIAQPAITIS